MDSITTVRHVMAQLARGACIEMRYAPRWPGDSPRNQYELRRDGKSLSVSSALLVRTTRLGRLDSERVDDKLIWRLKPTSPQGGEMTTDLLGDPLPPVPAMTAPLPMRVFRMNDCDWWMARSLAEAKASYLAAVGPMSEDEAFDDPYELSDADLDRLMFVDTDVDENPIKDSRRTFREELQQRIDAGIDCPQQFASTEH